MKNAKEVLFSITRQQLALLTDPDRKANTLGPDSRYILEKRGLLTRSGGGWHISSAGAKLLRALNACGVDMKL